MAEQDLRLVPAIKESEEASALVPVSGPDGQGFRSRPLSAFGEGVDEQARRTAGEAAVMAAENRAEIMAEETARRSEDSALGKRIDGVGDRLDSIPVYAGTLAVWPPNVRKHSDLQRTFQSTLSGLVNSLATDAGSTGTRFANVFRILAQNADGVVVELHTQGWSITNDERQTIEWEVSADEFNRLGTEVDTNGLEVWGEFRAVYGGGVDEFRGRTNPFFIDFGEEDEWPATRGDLKDPRRLLAALSWDVNPSKLSGRAAADFERTYRLEFEVPYIDMTHLFYEVHVEGFKIGDRAKWAQVTHLDAAVDATTAVNIALNLPADRDHIEVQIFMFTTMEGVTHSAVAIRRVEIAEPGEGLSLAERVGLLHLTSDLGSIPFKSDTDIAALVARVQVRFANPEVLGDGEVWAEGSIQGQPALARTSITKVTSAVALVPAGPNRDAIASAVAAAGDGEPLNLELTFFDAAQAGNEIERLRVNVPVVDRSDVVALEARSPTAVAALAYAANVEIDYAAGAMRAITLTGDVTFSLKGFGVGDVLVVEASQDATGGRGITWPASVDWPGGNTVAPSAGANAKDVFTLIGIAPGRQLAVALLDVS